MKELTLTATAILMLIGAFLFGYVMRDLTERSIISKTVEIPELTSVGSNAGDKA